MKGIRVKAIKWLANQLGFKIVMVKICKKGVSIQGDKELMMYTDLSGYTFKKEPFERFKKHVKVEGMISKENYEDN